MNKMYFQYILILFMFDLKFVNCGFILITQTESFPNVTKSECIRNSTQYKGIERNVLGCARKCMHGDQCKGLVYNETNRQCQIIGGGVLSATSKDLSGNTYEVVNWDSSETWNHVLTVTSTSTATQNELKELKDALQSGYKLRINYLTETNFTFSFLINSVSMAGDVICGQSEMYMAESNDYDIVSYLMCTNGHIRHLKRTIGSRNIIIRTRKSLHKCDWFLRRNERKQSLSGSDVIKSRDTVYDLLTNIHSYSLAILQTSGMTTKLYYRAFGVLEKTDRQVKVTSQGELSKVMDNSSISFTNNTSLITNNYNYSTHVTEHRCNVRYDLCETRIEPVSTADIFIDLNWKKVFHQLSDGEAVYGSECSLRQYLLAGHRVLVNLEGRLRVPDIIIFDDENVSAVFMLYPSTDYTTSNAEVVWEILSTSGKYELLVFDYTTSEILLESSSFKEGLWFVDGAKWTNVNNDRNNSTTELRNAVDSGAEIRIKSNCLYENVTISAEYLCLYNADSVTISGIAIKAKTRMFPGVVPKDGRLLFDVQYAIPKWMALEVKEHSEANSGWLSRKNWALGNLTSDTGRVKGGDITANIVWYAN